MGKIISEAGAGEISKKDLAGKKLKVTQTRSVIGRSKDFRKVIAAMGLGRVGNTTTFTGNDAVIGMIKRVRHIVRVESV
jgi:large subunit ribosomal protein L30